jgi:hypothetical protein
MLSKRHNTLHSQFNERPVNRFFSINEFAKIVPLSPYKAWLCTLPLQKKLVKLNLRFSAPETAEKRPLNVQRRGLFSNLFIYTVVLPGAFLFN